LFIFTGICCCIPFCVDSCQDTELVCVVCQCVKARQEANCCWLIDILNISFLFERIFFTVEITRLYKFQAICSKVVEKLRSNITNI
jgi:hypothetical protein